MRLVLLPGLNGGGELFAPLRQVLPTSIETQVLTLPDQGPQDHASLAGQLLPTLEAFEEPLVLLGESFSGALAHRLCRQLARPPLGLILASSFLQRPRHLIPPPWLVAALRERLEHPWLIEHFCLGSGASPALREQIGEAIRHLPTALLKARVATLIEMKPPPAVLRLPVLQLAASNDRLLSQAASRSAARHCSDLQRIELAGPHFLLQRQPEACAAAIQAFLSRLTSPALP